MIIYSYLFSSILTPDIENSDIELESEIIEAHRIATKKIHTMLGIISDPRFVFPNFRLFQITVVLSIKIKRNNQMRNKSAPAPSPFARQQ